MEKAFEAASKSEGAVIRELGFPKPESKSKSILKNLSVAVSDRQNPVAVRMEYMPSCR